MIVFRPTLRSSKVINVPFAQDSRRSERSTPYMIMPAGGGLMNVWCGKQIQVNAERLVFCCYHAISIHCFIATQSLTLNVECFKRASCKPHIEISPLLLLWSRHTSTNDGRQFLSPHHVHSSNCSCYKSCQNNTKASEENKLHTDVLLLASISTPLYMFFRTIFIRSHQRASTVAFETTIVCFVALSMT